MPVTTHLTVDPVSAHRTLEAVLDAPDQGRAHVQVVMLLRLHRTLDITRHSGEAGQDKVFNILSSDGILRSVNGVLHINQCT